MSDMCQKLKKYGPSKKCEHHGCGKSASYGDAGTSKRTFCSNHREEIHTNNSHKLCASCPIVATYGIFGTKIPLYCTTHKLPGNVDVTNKFCDHDGCKIRATFKLKIKGVSKFCVKHYVANLHDPSNFPKLQKKLA